jgi:hypothetical protein
MRIVSGGRLASAIAFLAVFGAGCGSVEQRAALDPSVDGSALADGDGERNELSDREPEDPLEYRTPIVPPERPAARGGPTWQSRGPAPTRSAQVDVPPDNEVCGAIQAIAAHPTNADIVYVGTVNGGIWKTTNATAPRPTWVAQTDGLPSLSIGAIAFDATDATQQTLIAGIGRWSNFARRGDDEIGVYRTTNGGTTWTLLGATTLLGQRMSAVSARGAVLMAASTNGGLFRSTNTGATWTLVSGTSGLPTGGIADMEADPSNANRFYAAVLGATPSIRRSDDGGASWIDVTSGLVGLSAATTNIRLSVGSGGVLYVAAVNSGALAIVSRSPDLGATWTAMDVPSVHPGGQGVPNTAIAADPANPNLVYISGDRITTSPFTGNVVRGNFAATPGTQFTPIMDAGGSGTAPHADSRDMEFDANGNLLESDDGGIYRRSQPSSAAGSWSSVIGNLDVMEIHDLAHDRVSNILIIGTQDNGTHMQVSAAVTDWLFLSGGDGGDVAVDDSSLGTTASYRYTSSQNLGGFRRRQFSNTNVAGASIAMPGISDVQFVTPIELNVTDDSRLLVGGVNTVYESTNANTAAPTLTSLGTPGANRNAMAYGSTVDPNAAYVGKNAAVFRRQGAAFVATTALPAGAATITDVAMDPEDPNLVFAVDDNQVFRSIDAGATWVDVTGNLPSIASQDFRTIEFIPSATGDTVALGTRSGVYVAATNASTWSLLGSGLPDVLVFDLRFVPQQQVLYAGTLGRGVWSVALGTPDALFSNGFE